MNSRKRNNQNPMKKEVFLINNVKQLIIKLIYYM